MWRGAHDFLDTRPEGVLLRDLRAFRTYHFSGCRLQKRDIRRSRFFRTSAYSPFRLSLFGSAADHAAVFNEDRYWLEAIGIPTGIIATEGTLPCRNHGFCWSHASRSTALVVVTDGCIRTQRGVVHPSTLKGEMHHGSGYVRLQNAPEARQRGRFWER